jgi:hypothetical protein
MNMRKKVCSLLFTCLLILALAVPAYAEEYQGADGWEVDYDGSSLNSSFDSGDLSDAAAGLQPGDSITFTIALKNSDSQSMDWWMTNKVLESFEDNSVANGGAYTYILTYTDSTGAANLLYSSESVGGEDTTGGEGLHEATGALEKYFYLDTLSSGGSGTITLQIALDGETQGNDYQNTLANLQMNFAVEATTSGAAETTPETTPESTAAVESTASNAQETTAAETVAPTKADNSSHSSAIKTGDDTQYVPYLIAMGVCGVILLILAIYSLIKSRKKDEKGAV